MCDVQDFWSQPVLSFTWSSYIWQRHCAKGEKRKNAHNYNSFSASLLFMCFLCFKDSKAADVKRGDSHHSNGLVRKEQRRWCQCDPDQERSASAPLGSTHPAHSFGRDTSSQKTPVRAMKHITPSPWCSHRHSNGLSITPMLPGASTRALQTALRACLMNLSLLRAPKPAAGRADRASPLTQRASAGACPKQHGPAEPRCGSSALQRNGCAKEGWASYTKARALKDSARCSAWPKDLPPHNMETIRHWEPLSCSFSFSHPIPALLKQQIYIFFKKSFFFHSYQIV